MPVDIETKNLMSTTEELRAFWDAAPCEAWHSAYKVGSSDWSREVTAWRYFIQPHILDFADFWKWKGKRVLEIGCGIGTDTLQFARAGAEVEALEYSQLSMALAGTRLKGLAHLHWRNAEEWLPVGPFDLIYSFGVLHHTPHPERILRLARLRIRPDGELRIMLYAKWSIKHLLGTQPEAKAGCPLVRWYSARSARQLVESCGWRVVDVKKTHIFPWQVKAYRGRRFVKRWMYSLLPLWMFRLLERGLGHHLLIRAVPE